MASLPIRSAFVESKASRGRSGLDAPERLGGRKTLQVSCHQSSADFDGQRSGSDSDGDQEAVRILQSSRNPLLNLPRQDLMAALVEKDNQGVGQGDSVRTAARRRSERVIFTEEKARLLRKENRATQTFHDKWYHSAIASKLAMPED